MPGTEGATKAHVELAILRCLAAGGWKEAGEIKDYVGRNANLPPESRKSLKDREAEPQVNNAVQNCISPSRKGGLTALGHVEYDSFKQAYKITSDGRERLKELERWNDELNKLFDE